MDYIYKLEVDCFKFDGKYECYVWCRDKHDAIAQWAVCAIYEGNTPKEAFEEAYHWMEKCI